MNETSSQRVIKFGHSSSSSLIYKIKAGVANEVQRQREVEIRLGVTRIPAVTEHLKMECRKYQIGNLRRLEQGKKNGE